MRLKSVLGLLVVFAGYAAAAVPGDDFTVLDGWRKVRGNGQFTVQEGRLATSGTVTLSRRFKVDLDRFSRVEIKIDEAEPPPNQNFVIKTVLPGVPEKDLVRSPHAGLYCVDLPRNAGGVADVDINLYLFGQMAIDHIRFLTAPERRGGEPPAAAAALTPAGSEAERQVAWYFKQGDTTLAVWRANGGIAGLWLGGSKVYAFCQDLYRVETLKEATESWEIDDRVAHAELSDDRLELVCANPRFPGIEIRKRYVLRPEAGAVSKRVEFRTDRDWQGVVHWVSDATLDPDFRRGGRYKNTEYHMRRDPFIPAEAIRIPTAQPERQFIYFMATNGITAGHYRLRANDRTVGAWTWFAPVDPGAWESDMYYTPHGWQFKAHLDRLGPATHPSAEVHYVALQGDFDAMHRHYIALPEYREANTLTPPAWVAQVKGGAIHPSASHVELRRWNDLLEEGYGHLLYLFGPRDQVAGWKPDEIDPVEGQGIRDMLRKLRAHAPRYKIGPYSWIHSAPETTTAFVRHPEWFARRRDGTLAADGDLLRPRLLVPEHVDWLRETIRRTMTDYDFDFFYVDGGQFGHTRVDWPTMRVVQPYDYTRMYAGCVVGDKPAFFNAALGLRSFNNAMGYCEGFIEVEDWRALALKLHEVKLYQQPGTWTMALYLTSLNRQPYVNYAVMLGLKPDAAITRETLPLINMSYEVTDMLLQEIGLRPRWWLEPTELEAHALGWKDAFLITLLNHDGQPAEADIRFDPKLTALAPDRPTYVYQIRTQPAPVLWANRLSEPEERRMYEATGWTPTGLPRIEKIREHATAAAASSQTVRVRPGVAELIGVTQVPALVWSVEGRRKYFPLSRTRWGEVRGLRRGEAIELETTLDRPGEIAVILPEGWGAVDAEVDGQAAPWRLVADRLAVLGVPAGNGRIRVVKAAAAAAGVDKLDAPAAVARGQALEVALEARGSGRGFIAISQGINPVYSGQAELAAGRTAIRIAVPLEAMPGDYTLRAGTGGDWLERPLRIDIDPLRMPAGWDARANADVRIGEQAVDLPGGFRVLRTFEQHYGCNSGNQARAVSRVDWNDKPSATIEAAMGGLRMAGYGHAGIEFENIRTLGANIAFSRPPLDADGREAFARHPEAHVSFSLDYHTAAGYVRRVIFHANGQNDGFTAKTRPWWGTALESGEVETRRVLFRGALGSAKWPQTQWDLADHAPAGWDGRVILGCNVSLAETGTRLFMRLLPRSKFEGAGPALNLGPEEQWTNVSFRRLPAIAKGDGAVSTFDGQTLHFSATGGAGHAIEGVKATDLFIPTLRIQAQGDTFLAVDYLLAGTVRKRVFLMLSGTGDAARMRALDLPGAPGDSVEVADLRAEVAATPARFDLVLGRFAPQGWYEGGKICLFRAGALAGGKLDLQVVLNETFLRF